MLQPYYALLEVIILSLVFEYPKTFPIFACYLAL